MNILMSLNSMNIGGIQTHVVELSNELKKRGHNVVIASNGGVLVAKLEELGIKYYTVPLHNKAPKNIFKSISMLKDIVSEEKIDIVHTHDDVSSFIFGKIYKKIKVPFVTTAHGIYNTKQSIKSFVDLGKKIIVFSEDIKKRITSNRKIAEERVFVSVDGVDINKYIKKPSSTDILSEMGIADDNKVILHISKLDKDDSYVAHNLISAVKKLDGIIDGIKCIIVGNGDDFDNLKKESDDVNTELSRDAIILTGTRIDVCDVLPVCNLFIGESRSALEAMSCHKPVILAGNEGFIGLFDERKYDAAVCNNFNCCDNKIEQREFIQSIADFFGLWDEDWDRLGEFSRKTIEEGFSLKKAADEVEKIYADSIK